MHRVFTVSELVELIVENVAGHERLTRSRRESDEPNLSGLSSTVYRDVTSLALTASLFREGSLNAIWHTQHSLLPLLRSADAVIHVRRRDPVDGWFIEDYVRAAALSLVFRVTQRFTCTGMPQAIDS